MSNIEYVLCLKKTHVCVKIMYKSVYGVIGKILIIDKRPLISYNGEEIYFGE